MGLPKVLGGHASVGLTLFVRGEEEDVVVVLELGKLTESFNCILRRIGEEAHHFAHGLHDRAHGEHVLMMIIRGQRIRDPVYVKCHPLPARGQLPDGVVREYTWHPRFVGSPGFVHKPHA